MEGITFAIGHNDIILPSTSHEVEAKEHALFPCSGWHCQGSLKTVKLCLFVIGVCLS